MSFAVLEQSVVILSFVFEGQAGRVRCIVICINSAPTQMIDGTEKPIRKRALRYSEFGYTVGILLFLLLLSTFVIKS